LSSFTKTEAEREAALEMQALKRIGKPEDVADVVVFLTDAVVRVVGPAAILTAATKTVTSRSGKESQAHFRLVAFYIPEGDAIRLVHFQSTSIAGKAA
jgi:hypothetical protein